MIPFFFGTGSSAAVLSFRRCSHRKKNSHTRSHHTQSNPHTASKQSMYRPSIGCLDLRNVTLAAKALQRRLAAIARDRVLVNRRK
jgi:hypothetical protein